MKLRTKRLLAGLLSACATIIALELALRWGFLDLPLAANPPLFQRHSSARLRYTNRANFQDFAYGVPVRIDSLGLRGPGLEIPKPPGLYRLLLLGDSIAFGFGVGEGEAFASVLERLLRPPPGFSRVEIVNAAVVGYNTEQEVEFYRVHGQSLQADAVLLFYVHNDTFPASFAGHDGYLYYHDPETTPGVVPGSGGGVGGDRLPPVLNPLRRHSRLFEALEARFLRFRAARRQPVAEPARGSSPSGLSMESMDWMNAYQELLSKPAPRTELVPEVLSWKRLQAEEQATQASTREILKTLFLSRERAGWQRVVSAFEELVQLLRAKPEGPVPLGLLVYFGSTPQRGRILALAQRFGLPVCNPPDAVGTVDEVYQDMSLGWDSHPNAAVHRAMAEAVAWHLQEWGWLTTSALDPRERMVQNLERSADNVILSHERVKLALHGLQASWQPGQQGFELLESGRFHAEWLLASQDKRLELLLEAPKGIGELSLHWNGRPWRRVSVQNAERQLLSLPFIGDGPFSYVGSLRLESPVPLHLGPGAAPDGFLAIRKVAIVPGVGGAPARNEPLLGRAGQRERRERWQGNGN